MLFLPNAKAEKFVGKLSREMSSARELVNPDVTILTPRRAEHGGTGWAMGSAVEALYQPQDGAANSRSRIADRIVDMGSRLRRMAGEPDDARLTGATRSLGRRLSGLNVSGLKLGGAMPRRTAAGSALPAMRTYNAA